MQTWSEMLCKRWIPWTHIIPSTCSNNMMNWKCNTPSFEQIKNDGIKSKKCWYVLKHNWKYVCYRFGWVFLKHRVNEKFYKRKLKAYKGAFFNFNVYFPPQTLDRRAMNIISLIKFWFYNFEIWIFWLFIFVKVYNYHFVGWIIIVSILK